jgi:hypothetical protein
LRKLAHAKRVMPPVALGIERKSPGFLKRMTTDLFRGAKNQIVGSPSQDPHFVCSYKSPLPPPTDFKP